MTLNLHTATATDSLKSALSDFPVVIAGGGLAGCAAGAVLARAGWPVLILERDSFPRDKLCGEFLSGESRRLLHEIGCLSQILDKKPPVLRQAHFVSREGARLAVNLPEPAYGVSRQLLDETLFNHALSSGARGITGCEVRNIEPANTGTGQRSRVRVQTADNPETRELNPSLTIAAYGRRSQPDYGLKRPFLKKIRRHVGLKIHLISDGTPAGERAFTALAHSTHIFGLTGGYCGVNPVDGERINLCALLTGEAFRRLGSAEWSSVYSLLVRDNKSLGQALEGLTAVSDRMLTVAGIPFSIKEQPHGDIVFVGDAAGMIVPLCGDGQAMALESGLRLGKQILRTFRDPASISTASLMESGFVSQWALDWKQRYRSRVLLGRSLQSALFHAPLGHAAISLLRMLPASLPDYLAKATRTHTFSPNL